MSASAMDFYLAFFVACLSKLWPFGFSTGVQAHEPWLRRVAVQAPIGSGGVLFSCYPLYKLKRSPLMKWEELGFAPAAQNSLSLSVPLLTRVRPMSKRSSFSLSTRICAEAIIICSSVSFERAGHCLDVLVFFIPFINLIHI